MSTEIQDAVERVAKLVNDVKTDATARSATTDAKIEALQSQLLGVQQAQAASARAAHESKAGGDAADLGGYVERAVPVEHAGRYMRHKDVGALRLGGHFASSTTPSGEAHRSWQWGLLDDPEPRTLAQLELQRAVTDRNFARLALRKSNPGRSVHTPSLDARVRDAARACGGEVAKIFADSSGIGAEWVPDTYLPELERDVEVETGVRSMFRQRNLPPGGVKVPQRSGRLRVYRHATPTADYPAAPTLATLTTANSQIDPVSAYAGVQIDRDLEEDSIVPILAELRKDLAMAIAFAEDDSIINGDDAATHQDTISGWDTRGELGSSGLGTTADHRKRWLGLRARAYDLYALDNSYGKTDQNAAQTFAGMRTALAKLGPRNLVRGSMGRSDIVVLVSFEYFFNKMLDATAFAEFITFEKVGALASVLTGKVGDLSATPGGLLPGQVGFLQGFIPVCVAWPITADLETSGLYTVGTGGKTGFLCVDRSRFEYCVRKGAMLESETSVLANTDTLMMRFRTKFRPMDATAATVRDVHWSYNL